MDTERLAEVIDAESRKAKLGAGIGKSDQAKDQRTDGLSPSPTPPKKLGRPSTGFDKKAYNRQYMRDKRAGKR